MIKKLSYLLAALLLAFAVPALAETYRAALISTFEDCRPMQEYQGDAEPVLVAKINGYANGCIYMEFYNLDEERNVHTDIGEDTSKLFTDYFWFDAEELLAVIEPLKQGDFTTIVGAEAYLAVDENEQCYLAIRPGKNTRKSDEELADKALDTMEAYSESLHRLFDAIEKSLEQSVGIFNEDPQILYELRLDYSNPEYFPMCNKALSEWFKTHPAELRNYRNHFRKKYFKERNKELGEWYREHREELEADREIFGKKYFQDIK